eukprot:8895119-Pyramimonas_sp.AAC.1
MKKKHNENSSKQQSVDRGLKTPGVSLTMRVLLPPTPLGGDASRRSRGRATSRNPGVEFTALVCIHVSGPQAKPSSFSPTRTVVSMMG